MKDLHDIWTNNTLHGFSLLLYHAKERITGIMQHRFSFSALCIVAVVTLVFTGCPGVGPDNPETVIESIPITNTNDLAKIGNNPDYPLDGKYQLTADITLGNWTPIGDNTTPFTGELDGDSHTITVQSFDSAALAGQYIGIFGYIGGADADSGKAVVKNLGIAVNLSEQQTTTYSSGVVYIGMLAGYTKNAELSHITLSSSGGINFSDSTNIIFLGGITGRLDTAILTDSSSAAAITGYGKNAGGYYNYVGGVVGNFTGGGITKITKTHTTGDVLGATLSGNNVFAGGIAGGATYGNSTAAHGGTATANDGTGAEGVDCAARPEQSVYTGLGWDFTTVWEMGSGGYPVLKWQTP
jgi:hypothetical protein